MSVSAELEREVRCRARDRCEYCFMHQSLQGATFHVEHIIPRTRGGATQLDNLALACPGCNLGKSDRVEVEDPVTQRLSSLFHPRLQRWPDHFMWDGYRVVGLSPVGRATVLALDFNHPRRLRIRDAEQRFGLFPPAEDSAP